MIDWDFEPRKGTYLDQGDRRPRPGVKADFGDSIFIYGKSLLSLTSYLQHLPLCVIVSPALPMHSSRTAAASRQSLAGRDKSASVKLVLRPRFGTARTKPSTAIQPCCQYPPDAPTGSMVLIASHSKIPMRFTASLMCVEIKAA